MTSLPTFNFVLCFQYFCSISLNLFRQLWLCTLFHHFVLNFLRHLQFTSTLYAQQANKCSTLLFARRFRTCQLIRHLLPPMWSSLSLYLRLFLSLYLSPSLSLLSILHFRFSFLQFCLLYVRFIASLFSLCPCCPTIITKIEPCIDATVVVCIECSVNWNQTTIGYNFPDNNNNTFTTVVNIQNGGHKIENTFFVLSNQLSIVFPLPFLQHNRKTDLKKVKQTNP